MHNMPAHQKGASIMGELIIKQEGMTFKLTLPSFILTPIDVCVFLKCKHYNLMGTAKLRATLASPFLVWRRKSQCGKQLKHQGCAPVKITCSI